MLIVSAFYLYILYTYNYISFAAAGAKCTCLASSPCNARFNFLFLKSLHFKHENSSTRINKVGFMTVALLSTTYAACISDYRGNVVLANASLSQNDDRTLEPVKSQHSLDVHWHQSEAATVQAPLKGNEMKMDNMCGVSVVRVTDQWSSTESAY